MSLERHGFQAEVSRLLQIVAHSLYSDKSVFLRELISNASDACDKLRYLALTQPELLEGGGELAVTLSVDKGGKTLTIADNGIGMNKDDLISHLGTIARSGSAKFVEELESAKSAEAKVSLIGQFGVGFYSAFMVADKVTVLSRKAGETQGWRWISDGTGEFTIETAEKPQRGTEITLHLKKGEEEWLEAARLEHIIAKHSEHVALPIHLKDGAEEKHVNQKAALWTKSKSEITEEQYRDFYRHIAHAWDEPWATIHYKAEGKIDYTALLFIPSQRPMDLFNPDRKQSLKLYAKRVFITDQSDEILPGWLRFVRGLVDSEDLQLNISREMLQASPLLAKIRAALVKRVLSELGKRANDEDKTSYESFWGHFGAVLKEGLYEDPASRDEILKLARFRSTGSDGWVSLADYAARMKEGQKAIYYIAGDQLDALARSAQIEGFKAKGIEVLLLTDPIDEFWIPAVEKFGEAEFRSVTRAGADLSEVKSEQKTDDSKKPVAENLDALISFLKVTYKDAVKDVRVSERLTDSACCLVADSGDMDMHLERLLRQHKRLEASLPRVLEVNGSHPLVAAMAKQATKDGDWPELAETAWLLLDEARIQDGELPADPAAFVKRLNAALAKVV
ncbi:molecular chaperone HtpG [Dongia mobilis]|uniref:Chaperone protein HtpG n=1 Tax=Dongia mobilis TaxID=578943 RepID=A0A4R6WJ64_9PROT|nr:molecular chaperone HtpG [Dongia mobilis]TDQ78560.1 molecular chaperone HtpG [Dongia mobilis]